MFIRLLLFCLISFCFNFFASSQSKALDEGFVLANIVITPNYSIDKKQFGKIVATHASFGNHVGLKALDALSKEDSIKASLIYYHKKYFLVSSFFPLVYAKNIDASFTLDNGKSFVAKDLDFSLLDETNQLAVISLDSVDVKEFHSLKRIAFVNRKNSSNQFVSLIDSDAKLSYAVEDAKYKVVNYDLTLNNTISHSIDVPFKESGSPLFTQDSIGTILFNGINLYEVSSSSKQGFSIGVGLVKDTLNNVQDSFSPSLTALDKVGERFLEAINSKDVNRIDKFLPPSITIEWVSIILDTASKEDRDIYYRWLSDNKSQNLGSYFSKVIAGLFLPLQKLSYRSSIIYDDSVQDEATTAFYQGELIHLVDWKHGYGGWALDSLPEDMLAVPLEDLEETRTILLKERHRNSGVFFGAGSLIDNFRPVNIHIGYDVNPAKYFLASFMLAYESMPYEVFDSQYKVHFLEPSVALRVQVPIDTKKVRIVPFIGMKIGMPIMLAGDLPADNPEIATSNLYNSHVTLSLGWLTGMEFGIGPNPFYYVGFEMGYKEDSISKMNFGASGSWYGRGYIKFAIY